MKLTSSSDSWLPKAAPPIEILGTGALAYLHHPLSAAAVPVGEWALSKAMTSKPVVGHLIDQIAPAAQANRGALLSGTHAWLDRKQQ